MAQIRGKRIFLFLFRFRNWVFIYNLWYFGNFKTKTKNTQEVSFLQSRNRRPRNERNQKINNYWMGVPTHK